MHVPGPSTRLLHAVVPNAARIPCNFNIAGRSIRLRPLHVAASHSYARGAPHTPTPQLTNAHRVHRMRTFSSTSKVRAAQPEHPSGQVTDLVYCPKEEDLHELEDEDADGPEVDLIPPEEATLEVTDRAAEQLQKIAKRENNEEAALRIAVESGGCHGYQYKMELAKRRNPDD
ncbi:hypothetical protein EIP86_010044 [Pleurotus ostreatoroseus]|nr:hypothetical protein EIP86_010044 [Pleurotus ostreatoroseus]